MVRWLALCGWTAFIVYSMDVVVPLESAVIGRVSQWFAEVGLPEWLPAKIYHWATFAVWAFLLAGALATGYWKPLPDRALWTCAGGILVFAAITEILQSLNATRTPLFSDVCINLFGGATGLCCRALMRRLSWSRPLPLSTSPP